MSIEEFIQHQAVSGCLTMEDRQYLELRDVQKVIQMTREEGRSKLTLKGCIVKQKDNLLDRATLVMKIRSSSPILAELVERSTQPNTQPDNKPDTVNSRLLDEDTYQALMRLGILDTSVRSYNRGASDYSRHIIQPWTIWQDYNLNPWDADIVKRILRTKQGDSRRLDYEKIIHICEERIRQIDMEG